MATTLQNLQGIKANLIQSLADETLYQTTHGPRPNYNLDGEGYDFVSWESAVLDKIDKLNRLIMLEAGPFEIRSRVAT